ncbi:MAG: hypothetical protein P1V13_25820 [Rhizobiaceae bacterium]|nr:hypothetical protein [Rhizobiaceae bacterium]
MHAISCGNCFENLLASWHVVRACIAVSGHFQLGGKHLQNAAASGCVKAHRKRHQRSPRCYQLIEDSSLCALFSGPQNSLISLIYYDDYKGLAFVPIFRQSKF